MLDFVDATLYDLNAHEIARLPAKKSKLYLGITISWQYIELLMFYFHFRFRPLFPLFAKTQIAHQH